MKRNYFPIFLTVTIGVVVLVNGGSLSPPPGPIMPTMRALGDVEPRIPVQSLPGSAVAMHRISQPGSYYLAGNIRGMPGMHGIEIAADNVVIDMMGFVLDGGRTPTGGSGLCGIADLSFDPKAPSSGYMHTKIENGAVANWAAHGVLLGKWAVLKDMLIHDNGGPGIRAGNGVWMEKMLVRGNGQGGMQADEYANVQYSWFLQNTGHGVLAGQYSYLNQVGSAQNTGNGAIVGDQSVTWGGAYNQNGMNGLVIGKASAVLSAWMFWNAGDGLQAMDENTMYWTKAVGNGTLTMGAGINCLGRGNRIQENTLSGNGHDLRVSGVENLIIGNSATAGASGIGGDMLIGPGNSAGPPVGPTNIGTSSNPHANYDH